MEFLNDSPFYQLTVLLALAAAGGFLGMLLRQPVVVSFLAVGVLVGPSGLDLLQSRENVELLAELGIAALLFLVGLKLDLKLIRTLGAVSLATGLGQVIFTSVVGFLIALALGLEPISAVYVAVALTFSSTIIIVKLLSDKREVDSLHGRIAIGFLIVQDLVVVLAMVVLSTLGIGAEADNNELSTLAKVLGLALVLLLAVGLFMRYLAAPLMRQVARSSELMVTFAIAWAALLAALAHSFGLSKELGGLLAGVSLASTQFREAVVARMSSLRDFLLLFFFIALGSQLDLSLLGTQVGPALALSLFVLIGNPIIVMIIMGFMGYRKRTGFLAGLTVAQISEFSLIFVAMGMDLGHLGTEELGLVTLVGLITIALSVYMITYSQQLYQWSEPVLSIFERATPYREMGLEQHQVSASNHDIILIGLGRYGSAIAKHLQQDKLRILALDFDPEVIRQWQEHGYDAVYGDASDPEFISTLNLHGVQWVISALPEHELGLTHQDPRISLIEALRQHGYEGKIAVSAHKLEDIEDLKRRGADLVLAPFVDAADRAAALIREE